MNGWIKRWAVVGLLLVAWAYAGEPPFRETARVALGQPVREWEAKPMAFTNNTWQAVSDGNWGNTSNWTLGVVPAGTHVAIFDGTSSISVTSGLAGSTFEQLLVKPEYGGNIGSQGNPLRVDLGFGSLVWRGRGQGFIHTADGSFANVTCDVPNPFNGSRYNLVIGGLGVGTATTIAQVGIKRGNVNIMGDVNFTAPVHMLGDAARLVINPSLGGGMADPIHMFCAAGELINSRPLQANKILVVGDRSRVTQIGALVATNYVLVIGNGKFQYLPTSAPGTNPLLTVIGGVYDQTSEKWNNVWGTVVTGPDGLIIGGAVRGTGVFPADMNFEDEYPGAKE